MVAKTSGMHSMATKDDVVRSIIDKKLEGVEIVRDFGKAEFYRYLISNSVEGLVSNLESNIAMSVGKAKGSVVH